MHWWLEDRAGEFVLISIHHYATSRPTMARSTAGDHRILRLASAKRKGWERGIGPGGGRRAPARRLPGGSSRAPRGAPARPKLPLRARTADWFIIPEKPDTVSGTLDHFADPIG